MGRQFDGAALLESEAEEWLVFDPGAVRESDGNGGVGRSGIEDESLRAAGGAAEGIGEPAGGVAGDHDTRDREMADRPGRRRGRHG